MVSAKKKSRQISISIPEEMWMAIRDFKEDLGVDVENKNKKKVSKICQDAISKALFEAKAHHLYRKMGIEDGKRLDTSYSDSDQKYIARVLDDDGPYKKWSKFEKIEEIKAHLEEIRGLKVDFLYPKFISIVDDEYDYLDEWITQAGEKIVADRLSEVAWSYATGCIEGVAEAYLTNQAS